MESKKLSIFLFSAWYPTETHLLLGNFVQNHAKAISKFAQVVVIHPFEDRAYKQKEKFTIDERQIESLIEVRIKYRGIRKKNYLCKLMRFFRVRRAYQKGIQFAIQKY